MLEVWVSYLDFINEYILDCVIKNKNLLILNQNLIIGISDGYLNMNSMLFANLGSDPVSTLGGGGPLATCAWSWVKTSWSLVAVGEGPVDKTDSLASIVVAVEDINPVVGVVEVESSTALKYIK